MALFRGKKKRFMDSPAIDPRKPETTVLASGLRLEGDLKTAGDAIVDGQIDGRLEVGGRLHLTQGGRLKGSVSSEAAKLEGTVDGPVTVTGRLEIGETAQITGDVTADRIAIAEGASIRGALTSADAPHRFVERRNKGESGD